MPRRHEHKKKNKRHRKGSHGGDSREDSYDAPVTTSLEEDLRQQRIRQQERQKLQELEDEKKGAEDLIEDEDCNHDVGFQSPWRFENDHGVANAVAKTNHLVLKGTVLPLSTIPQPRAGDSGDQSSSFFMSSVIRLPPSFLLRHIEQTSPLLSMHNRNTLRKLWPTQHHLETMTILPRAASLYCKTKWPQHHHTEYNSDLRCSWDMSCKHRLHPSARTLDVAMLGSDPTPTIATIFQDGWGLLRKKSQHKINTIKAPPAYAIRMHERSAMCGMIVRQARTNHHHHNATPSSYSFRWYPLPHATSYVEANIPRPVTDFCFGTDIALFSCPRYSPRSSESLNPLFLPLEEARTANDDDSTMRYTDSAVRSINVRNFPQSDALRVEMVCEQQEKLVAFGHRNGQVSVLDLRASGTVCSILQYEASAEGARLSGSKQKPLGSVSDLGFLAVSSGGHRVLVKRSFGSCQLHDLRKVSSSNGSSNNRTHTSTTVVRNMDVPPDEINSMLTANCNGFAIDPNSNQTMVSPYISSSSGDARLGVWSLDTGRMVGSRLLLANHDRNREGSTTLYAEVCSKTTPSLQPNGTTDGGCDDPSFGVWLKCGAITNGKLRSRVGSLHQISVPGRWKSDEDGNGNGAS